MTTELEQLRTLRPDVSPPSDQARGEAWQQLMAAIEDEPAGWHGHRHEDDASRHPARRHRARHGLRLRLGVAGALAVVVVIVGAIVVLAGRHASDHPAPAAHGSISAGGHALAPGVIRKGLEQQYRAQLATGDRLHTFLDPALERVGRSTLLRSMQANSGIAGAYVAMDPQTGAVRAIGSLSRGHHTRSRMVDLATGLAGPIGSAFAPITVLAALRSGAWTPGERFDDTGEYCVGSGPSSHCLHNGGNASYGVVAIPTALRVEDHAFLGKLAVQTEIGGSRAAGAALQRTARALGIGHTTGIDLPGEAAGRLPSPSAAHGSDSLVRDESLAIGQGDLEVSPIQLAVAYAAIENRGKVVQPRIGSDLTVDGHTEPISPTRGSRVPIPAAQLDTVREGLREAVGATGGVAADTLGSLPVPVSAQVGTVQYRAGGRQSDDAWLAGFAPASHGHSPLVVVVYVAEGGFGDVAAAPVARALFSQWYTGRPGPYVAGSSTAG
jgi:penicillin-binding protein 2